MTPRQTTPPPLQRLKATRIGPFDGHLWEQAVLPMRSRGPLLNLCNTAPIARAAQIVCIHDANVFEAPESYGRAFRVFYKTLQPLLAKRAARVATVSRDSARQLSKHLALDEHDLIILPDGHEHAFRWDAAASILFRDAPPRRPYVLLLGSRARHKNAALLLGLAEPLDALGLDIFVAGASADIYAEEGLRGGENVRFLGKVTDDDLALLFSKALCLAFPSFTEGFGLPVIESMARGCPVVSSDRASLPEICGEAALIASPDDPQSWLRHIRSLKESSNLGDELRGRARKQVALFSWFDTARGYIEAIERMQ